jgi:hypothetical protein
MKHKMLALVLALTVVSWAQNATQTTPADPQQNSSSDKKCACCDKMASADSKDGQVACQRHGHHSGDAKDMSCCGGKDAKSCMKADKTGSSCKEECAKAQAASASCGKECGKQCEKCCSSAKGEKASMGCCKHEARS